MMTVGRNGASISLRKPHRAEIESGVKDLAQRVEGAIEQIGRDISISPKTRDQITSLLIADALAGIREGAQLELPLIGVGHD